MEVNRPEKCIQALLMVALQQVLGINDLKDLKIAEMLKILITPG